MVSLDSDLFCASIAVISATYSYSPGKRRFIVRARFRFSGPAIASTCAWHVIENGGLAQVVHLCIASDSVSTGLAERFHCEDYVNLPQPLRTKWESPGNDTFFGKFVYGIGGDSGQVVRVFKCLRTADWFDGANVKS